MYIKTEFRPLEYIEVQEGKPLIIDINEKWQKIKFNLWPVDKFLYFNREYKYILKMFTDLPEGTDYDKLKVVYYNQLIDLFCEICKDNFTRWQYRKFRKDMKLIFFNDMNKLIEVYMDVERYNSEVKKKLEDLRDFDIWQSNALWMIGGVPLSKYTRTNEKGEKYLIPRFSLN